jgi:hypothetical protein
MVASRSWGGSRKHQRSLDSAFERAESLFWREKRHHPPFWQEIGFSRIPKGGNITVFSQSRAEHLMALKVIPDQEARRFWQL